MEFLPQAGAPVVLTNFAELAVLHMGVKRLPVPGRLNRTRRQTHLGLKSRAHEAYDIGSLGFYDFAISQTELPILEMSLRAITQELYNCSLRVEPRTHTYYSTGRTEWDLCALDTYEELQQTLPRLQMSQ